MSRIDYQALRGAAEAIKIAATPQKLLAFRMKVTPQVVLALLDERDALNERLAELEADLAGLAEDQQKSIESIKQADEAVKLAHEKFSALAAENELARKAVQAFCDVVGDNTEVIAEVVGRDSVLVILEDMKATGNMPATDAFLAEVRAQGVEMLAKNHQSIVNALKGDSLFSDGEYRHAAIVSAAVYFAAELRKGGNQ
ncbi:ead/Ea22-like family protein [Escherichia coli]|uniref:Ead/Ea22-like family protein n=2 Tax=Escherichia coli TaxID=562 RepID=A0AAJ2YBR5_ECOLX|nr:ead/Ea22-like family protein [Escherichia coli]EKQ3376751.1 ead/Ea22-like family protein [Escherichia coli]MUM75755.1 ead/Ea22-like family protein [Escherichia coli]HAW8198391.1 ead/Ea22-like family protein [Escherichia coli]